LSHSCSRDASIRFPPSLFSSPGSVADGAARPLVSRGLPTIAEMEPVLTPLEAARVDAESGQPVTELMERAGLAVAIAATEMGAGYGSVVAVLAGTGNNGGDGFVAARHLRKRGAAVTAYCLGYPRRDFSAARLAAIAAEHAGVRIVPLGAPQPADLVVDALFGSGFRDLLPPRVVPWTGTSAPVLAVDLPSGLDGASGQVRGAAFTATRTVTFHARKTGHLLGEGPDRVGLLTVADIGLAGGEPELRLAGEEDAPRPARHRSVHKWSAGSVLVVGGSPGITGAPVLGGQAALEFGAGAVTIACPGGVQPVLAAARPGLMTAGIGTGDRFQVASLAELLEVAARFDVLLLGPGLGGGQRELVEGVIEAWEKPLILDADGINAIEDFKLLSQRRGPTILTPHAGEFSRLVGDFEGPAYLRARRLASEQGVIVLLKGGPTFVVGEDSWVVTAGGPELASIGTGDVLAGMVAALVARGLESEIAARAAAFWHGRAASRLGVRTSVTAERLAAEIGRYAW